MRIETALFPRGFPGRDDSDDLATRSFTVADDQHPTEIAHTQHDEPIFFGGMPFIVELDRILIEKHGLCLFEGNAMLFPIFSILGFVPFKRYHTYSVCTLGRMSMFGPDSWIGVEIQ